MNSNIASSEIILHPCCLKEINTPFSIQHYNSVNFIFSLIYLNQSDLMVKCKQMFFFPWGLEIKLKFPEGQILLLFMTVSPLCTMEFKWIFILQLWSIDFKVKLFIKENSRTDVWQYLSSFNILLKGESTREGERERWRKDRADIC